MAEKKSNKANLGKAWEDKIIKKCLEYRKQNKALIIKIPTEFTILRRGAKIVSAFPREKAFLDFVGVLENGKTIFIEAKSTANKTSFPLSMIKEHQFDLCNEIRKYTDICYYLIYFKELKKTYLVHSEDIEMFRQTETRKSLPIKWLDEHGVTLDDNLDFLNYIYKKESH